MIKQTQSDWESLDKGVMCDARSNLTFPNVKKIATAYNIRYECKLFCDSMLYNGYLFGVMFSKYPEIIEVIIKDGEKIQPKLKFGDAFENQKPYFEKSETVYINSVLNFDL